MPAGRQNQSLRKLRLITIRERRQQLKLKPAVQPVAVYSLREWYAPRRRAS